MGGDPFERFERSRGGLLIPVLLFVLGAVPTVLAVRTMDPLVKLDPEEAELERVERLVEGEEVDGPIGDPKVVDGDPVVEESLRP